MNPKMKQMIMNKKKSSRPDTGGLPDAGKEKMSTENPTAEDTTQSSSPMPEEMGNYGTVEVSASDYPGLAKMNPGDSVGATIDSIDGDMITLSIQDGAENEEIESSYKPASSRPAAQSEGAGY